MTKLMFLIAIAVLVAVAAGCGSSRTANTTTTTATIGNAVEPSSFATAQLGSLKSVGGVILSSTQVSLQGGWYDTAVSCTANRTIRVRADISISPPGATRSRTYSRSGSFVDVNCAEGGPGVGFTITARKAGSACPDGSWKPATYSFLATATEPTKKLEAVDSLVWEKGGSC